MAKPDFPPVSDQAATQGLDHIPTALPPENPPPPAPDVTLHQVAFEHITEVGQGSPQIPDWLLPV